MKTSKEKLNDFVAFGSLPREVILDILDPFDLDEAEQAWNEHLEKLEKEFPKEERKLFIQQKMKEQIAFAINFSKRKINEYNLSKQKGEEFEKRKQIIDLLEYVKKRKEEWYQVGRGEVKPFKEVIMPDDYPLIKERGIKKFFETHLELLL